MHTVGYSAAHTHGLRVGIGGTEVLVGFAVGCAISCLIGVIVGVFVASAYAVAVWIEDAVAVAAGISGVGTAVGGSGLNASGR